MQWITQPEAWVALATLTALEIVLGIDNIIFISIITAKLPAERQGRARKLGLIMAMLTRLLLLFSLVWLMGMTMPLFTVLGNAISGRDIILIVGGMFLIGKSTLEIHDRLEGEEGRSSARVKASFAGAIVQIMLLDIVFSLDSVITAVGMARHLAVMALAIVIAVGFMLVSAGRISDFVERRPTVKMLALSFLLLVGVALIADGLDLHISKGYIYFAMAFSVFVEMLNMRLRKRVAPGVKLRKPFVAENASH
jgi:predicted tellurium resistance membrane protein TerC